MNVTSRNLSVCQLLSSLLEWRGTEFYCLDKRKSSNFHWTGICHPLCIVVSVLFFCVFVFLNKNFVQENLTTTRIDSCFSLGFPIAFNYRHENGDTKAEIRTVVWEKTHTTSDNHHPVTLVTVKRRLSIRNWSLRKKKKKKRRRQQRQQ